jgi:general secretion pathway protein G
MQVPGFQGSAVPLCSSSAAPAQAWFVRRTSEPRNIRTSEPKTNGWTLIELLIVLSIIMILVSMSLVTYRNSVTLAKEAALHSDLFMMRDAIDQYYADKGKYPETLQSLVSENYMRAIPKDPFTNSSDTWQSVEAEPQPGSTSAEPGVYEIKSGSDGTAIDGSKFSDW